MLDIDFKPLLFTTNTVVLRYSHLPIKFFLSKSDEYERRRADSATEAIKRTSMIASYRDKFLRTRSRVAFELVFAHSMDLALYCKFAYVRTRPSINHRSIQRNIQGNGIGGDVRESAGNLIQWCEERSKIRAKFSTYFFDK